MEERDHKKIGPAMDLYYIDPVVGKGLPLFLPKGATVRRELERFIIDEEIKRGYEHVVTPDLARLELYEKSGHYPHYKDSMYAPIKDEDEQFMLRPMTCPHHFQMFASRPRSYRELPLRLAEVAKLYRYEQSGELMGLQRVRSFCLADAHIFCASEEQAVEEVSKALDLVEYANDVFGFEMGKEYHYRLSLGDRSNTEKYYQDDAGWDKGEGLLRELLEKRGCDFVEAKDEAAFYGPKIDIQMTNTNGKEDTAFTVQYDLCMPSRFDLKYVGEDGKEHPVFVVHRSSIGALERIMAFLIEHYAGAFPLWLAPVQVKVLPISEKHKEYGEKVWEGFQNAGIRVELDDSDETLGKKIHNWKTEKVPYAVVIGDEEEKSKKLKIENRDTGQSETLPLDKLIDKLQTKIKKKQ